MAKSLAWGMFANPGAITVAMANDAAPKRGVPNHRGARMASHPHIHRIGQAIAVALTGLALVAIARSLDDEPTVRDLPHTVESRADSRPAAQGAPARLSPAAGSSWGRSAPAAPASRRPAISTAEPGSDAGSDWTAAAIGAAGLIVLAALGTTALVIRRHPRTAA
jgi:hypothetical protein